MTTKISVSLPDDLHETARAAADEAGIALSALLAHALRHYLEELALMEDGRKAVEEYLAENGPIELTPEEQRWADGVIASIRERQTDEHRAAS